VSRLRIAIEALILLATSPPLLIRAFSLMLLYWLKRAGARRAALAELRSWGISEEVCEELLDIIVPDLGGLIEWGSSTRSGSYC